MFSIGWGTKPHVRYYFWFCSRIILSNHFSPLHCCPLLQALINSFLDYCGGLLTAWPQSTLLLFLNCSQTDLFKDRLSPSVAQNLQRLAILIRIRPRVLTIATRPHFQQHYFCSLCSIYTGFLPVLQTHQELLALGAVHCLAPLLSYSCPKYPSSLTSSMRLIQTYPI